MLYYFLLIGSGLSLLDTTIYLTIINNTLCECCVWQLVNLCIPVDICRLLDYKYVFYWLGSKERSGERHCVKRRVIWYEVQKAAGKHCSFFFFFDLLVDGFSPDLSECKRLRHDCIRNSLSHARAEGH